MKMGSGKIAAILGILGALLLIASAFVGWYTIQITASGNGISVTGEELMMPGSSYMSNLGGNASSLSYSSTNLTNFGDIMMATQYILIAGFILGLLGGILYFASTMPGRQNLGKFAMILMVLALLLAIAAPAYVAAASPGAFKSDAPSSETNGSGPWASFSGSCSEGAGCFGGSAAVAGVSGSATWGPAAGWYIAWVGVVLLLIAVILLWRANKMAPAEPAPMDHPTTPATSGETYSMDAPMPPTAPPGGSQ